MREKGDPTVTIDDLISKARVEDGDAFRELIEPHRRELQVHCYQMPGSFQDAEDALVAVGTAVARCPPHSPVLAQLVHKMCCSTFCAICGLQKYVAASR